MVKGKVAVLGLGYAGLSFAVAVASRGFKVFGVDINERKVNLVRQGKVPFYEPELEELLNRVLRDKLLEVTTEYQRAINESNIIFTISSILAYSYVSSVLGLPLYSP